MNLPAFFDSVRASIFNGSLSHKQVQGCEILLAAMQSRGWTDRRWFAYVLATTYHETAATMQPIAEYGKGKGKLYGKPDPITGQAYYGRGYVQLTWKENYARMGDRLGLPLVTDPDVALEVMPAARILSTSAAISSVARQMCMKLCLRSGSGTGPPGKNSRKRSPPIWQ